MARRQGSPTDEDIERVAESILISDSFREIVDEDTFIQKYEEYFEEESHLRNDINFRDSTFRKYRDLNPDISDKSLFSKAGGKNLRRDKAQNAQTVVTDVKEYNELGASRADLKGLDTVPKKPKFNIPSRIKGKVVYSKKEYVTVKMFNKKPIAPKKVVRYRDDKGRFASPKIRD